LEEEEALDRAMWRNRFGGGFGPVVKQTTMNEGLINDQERGKLVSLCVARPLKLTLSLMFL
jgi:hypothetical protein